MSESIYIPLGAKPLTEHGVTQIRLGIQGAAFTGKTTAALTFPNPVLASFDRKASAHSHRADVYEVPFWDGVFCDSLVKRAGYANPPNRRDAFLKWLYSDALKITSSQTLIVDNSSGVEDAYHTQYSLEPVVSRSGEEDSFAQWRLKIDYFKDIFTAFKALKCNVVYLIHEAPDRDKKGELNGKIRPILTGQIGDKIEAEFTDWFGAIAVTKPQTPEQTEKLLTWARIDKPTLQEWLNSTPANHGSVYVWSTQNDGIRNCGTTSLHNVPKFILANYSSFSKYRKQ